MTHAHIRAELKDILSRLDDEGAFGAACFVSMAIDALDGASGPTLDRDESDSIAERSWPVADGTPRAHHPIGGRDSDAGVASPPS